MRRGRVWVAAVAVAASVGLAVPAQAAVGAHPRSAASHGYRWVPLVDLHIASTKGSSDSDSPVRAQSNVVVAGVKYKKLLAGTVAAGATGAATFTLGKHCTRFSTSVGVADDSPKKGYITFSVYLGDVAEVVKEPKHGKTATISLDATGVSKLVLRNTEPDPANSLSAPVVAAWPNAKVYCNTSF